MVDIFELAWANNLIIQEWVNGGLFPLNLSLCIVIAQFLITAWATPLDDGQDRWTDKPGVKTACALFWIFLADAIRSVLVWVTLASTAHPVAPPAPLGAQPLLAVFVSGGLTLAAVIALLATFRCVYLFSPPRWGHTYWMLTAATTLGFLIWAHNSTWVTGLGVGLPG